MSTNSKMIRLSTTNFQAEIMEYGQLAIVLFEASWSGFSHVIASILESMSEEFGQSIKIGAVDLDSNQHLADMYGIQEVPTILFFQNGRVIDRINGAVSRKTLVMKVQSQSND